MPRITITCDVPDDMSDPTHSSGLTTGGYEELVDALIDLGVTDIDTRAGE